MLKLPHPEAAKEDGHWDLNLGAAAIEREPRGSEGKGRGPHGSGVNRKDQAALNERREDM